MQRNRVANKAEVIITSLVAEDSPIDSIGEEDNKTMEMFGNLSNNVIKSLSFRKEPKSDVSVRLSKNSGEKLHTNPILVNENHSSSATFKDRIQQKTKSNSSIR
jgi:hypothetical protein